MNDGAALRIHPTGKAQLSISVQTQGQGHETTFAQIVAEELGIPPEDVDVVHGDTDTTPYGLGTYGSRSTPVSGAATALAARKVRERARVVAAAMLEVAADDLEWVKGPPARWAVKGDPEQAASLQDIAMAARGTVELPPGFEAGLDAEAVYDPPNLTFPFGAYVCVVDIDPGTAAVIGAPLRGRRRLRHAHQPDDHRGPGARRPDRRRRDGADGADRLRRGGQLPGRDADGLPDPHRAGGARLGDRLHGHAVAPPSDRRQGDRRVGHRRLAADDRQRDLRRAARRSACATWTCRARRRACGRRCARDEARPDAARLAADRRPRAVRVRDRRARGAADQRAGRRHRAGAPRRRRSTGSSAACAPRRRCAATPSAR